MPQCVIRNILRFGTTFSKCIARGKLGLVKVSMTGNVADMMTKGLLSGLVPILERTYGHEVDFEELAARAGIGVVSLFKILIRVLGIHLYFSFCVYFHYGGVSNVDSNGHIQTLGPIRAIFVISNNNGQLMYLI